jgi:hypothetical protein
MTFPAASAGTKFLSIVVGAALGAEQSRELLDKLEKANATNVLAGKPGIRFGVTLTEDVETQIFAGRPREYRNFVGDMQTRVLRVNGVSTIQPSAAELNALRVSTGWTGRGKFKQIDGELYFPMSVESLGELAHGTTGRKMVNGRNRTHQGRATRLAVHGSSDDLPIAYWVVSNEDDLRTPAVKRNLEQLANDGFSVFAFGNHPDSQGKIFEHLVPQADALQHILGRMKVDLDLSDAEVPRTKIWADSALAGPRFEALDRYKPSEEHGFPVISFEGRRLRAEAEATREHNAAWPGVYL